MNDLIPNANIVIKSVLDYGGIGVSLIVMMVIGYTITKLFLKVHNDFMDGQKNLVDVFRKALEKCDKEREELKAKITILELEISKIKAGIP